MASCSFLSVFPRLNFPTLRATKMYKKNLHASCVVLRQVWCESPDPKWNVFSWKVKSYDKKILWNKSLRKELFCDPSHMCHGVFAECLVIKESNWSSEWKPYRWKIIVLSHFLHSLPRWSFPRASRGKHVPKIISALCTMLLGRVWCDNPDWKKGFYHGQWNHMTKILWNQSLSKQIFCDASPVSWHLRWTSNWPKTSNWSWEWKPDHWTIIVPWHSLLCEVTFSSMIELSPCRGRQKCTENCLCASRDVSEVSEMREPKSKIQTVEMSSGWWHRRPTK